MRVISLVVLFLSSFLFKAQSADSLIVHGSSFLKKLKNGDSVIYYQCHVEDAVQQLSTVSGQTITGKPQKYSITERYVLKLVDGVYNMDYYSSSLTVFPNRKFSGLKIREKDYWQFKKERSFVLKEIDLKVLVSMEKKGREATEYDYPITKYTTNQLIIKSGKNFKQLVVEGDYTLNKFILPK